MGGDIAVEEILPKKLQEMEPTEIQTGTISTRDVLEESSLTEPTVDERADIFDNDQAIRTFFLGICTILAFMLFIIANAIVGILLIGWARGVYTNANEVLMNALVVATFAEIGAFVAAAGVYIYKGTKTNGNNSASGNSGGK